MGSLLSVFDYFDDDQKETWDSKSIRQKYLVNKQIEDTHKIKLKSVKANDFYSDLKNHFNKKKKKR